MSEFINGEHVINEGEHLTSCDIPEKSDMHEITPDAPVGLPDQDMADENTSEAAETDVEAQDAETPAEDSAPDGNPCGDGSKADMYIDMDVFEQQQRARDKYVEEYCRKMEEAKKKERNREIFFAVIAYVSLFFTLLLLATIAISQCRISHDIAGINKSLKSIEASFKDLNTEHLEHIQEELSDIGARIQYLDEDLATYSRDISNSLEVISQNAGNGGQWVDLPEEEEHGWMGVVISDGTAASEGGEVELQGVYVNEALVGEPAWESGIETGDLIVRVNDTEITNTQSLLDYMAGTAPGDGVVVYVVKTGDFQARPYYVTLTSSRNAHE